MKACRSILLWEWECIEGRERGVRVLTSTVLARPIRETEFTPYGFNSFLSYPRLYLGTNTQPIAKYK